MTKITIVDEEDRIVGAEERHEAWEKGLRHRIVNVVLFRKDGKILLQKRSNTVDDNIAKWNHSAGGHVDEGETYEAAARRETQEELGIAIIALQPIGKLYIERAVPKGFARRFYTLFVAPWNDEVHFDPEEVAEVKWCSVAEVKAWLEKRPSDFTPNFPKAFTLVQKYLEKQQ